MSTSRGSNGVMQERLVSSRTSTLWRLPSSSWWDRPQICSGILHMATSLHVARRLRKSFPGPHSHQSLCLPSSDFYGLLKCMWLYGSLFSEYVSSVTGQIYLGGSLVLQQLLDWFLTHWRVFLNICWQHEFLFTGSVFWTTAPLFFSKSIFIIRVLSYLVQ